MPSSVFQAIQEHYNNEKQTNDYRVEYALSTYEQETYNVDDFVGSLFDETI